MDSRKLILSVGILVAVVVLLLRNSLVSLINVESDIITSSNTAAAKTNKNNNINDNNDEKALISSDCSKKSKKIYSTFRCVDNGDLSFVGPENVYGFNIHNRSCLYENVVVENSRFIVYLHPTQISSSKKIVSAREENDHSNNDNNKNENEKDFGDHELSPKQAAEIIPPVTLSSRPFDLPQMHRKRVTVKGKMRESHEWRPIIRRGPIPCQFFEKDNFAERDTTVAYYSPIVAPWNFAHTLLCDLFGVFWAAHDLFGGKEENVPKNMHIVAYGRHYAGDFGLPNKNKAFPMMSTRPTTYEGGLKNGVVYGKLIAGMGTKSWSWVTPEYKANGSPALWFDFRKHILKTVGLWEKSNDDGKKINATKKSKKEKKTILVTFCHKKDKVAVVNYEEAIGFLETAAKSGYFTSENYEVKFELEQFIGKPAQKQAQIMLDTDIYICNEGTLSTPFFLQRPGSAYISIPLIFHLPHLHQRKMPPHTGWWKLPDPLRPDPRKNIGGNIDWFPPSIPWVKTFWYDNVPLNETQIQPVLSGLRNYRPEMNIIVKKNKILPLVKEAVSFVVNARQNDDEDENETKGKQEKNSFEEVPATSLTDRPNYSVTAEICRKMLEAAPNMTKSFNTARCLYSMSWLCEFWANTQFKWRFMHPKWSYHFCGGKASSVEYLKIKDPREQRPLKEFLFFTKDELLGMYNNTDFGKLKEVAGDDETRFF